MMNKNEYLAALKEALKDTDKEIMDEIVADYEEHFQAGMENGKSEEQICEELGSIEDLVKEIKEVYGTGQTKKQENKSQQEEKTKKESFHFKFDKFSFDNINGDTIGDAINSALNCAGEAISEIDVKAIGRSVKSALDQAAFAMGNFADSCMKGADQEYSSYNARKANGTSENVTKTYGADGQESTTVDKEDTEESVQEESKQTEEPKGENNRPLNLVIDGISADIIVKKAETDQLLLQYVNNGNERQKQLFEFYSYREGDTVYAGIRRVGRSVFMMSAMAKTLSIYVEIPDNMKLVQLKTANSDIEVTNCLADIIAMNSASGNLRIKDTKTKECQLKTASGSVNLSNVVSDKLKAQSLSGNVTVDDTEAKNGFIKSSSGHVKGNHIHVDIMNCTALSGAMCLNHVTTGECKIRNTGGNVEINELQMRNMDVSTVSGELKLSKVAGEGLSASSTSGDVCLDVDVKQCYAGTKSGDVDVQVNGDILLEAENTSGNVNVHLKNNGNGYCVNSHMTSGRMYVDYGEEHSRNLKSGTYVYGNQGSEMTLSTVSGDIYIKEV